MSYSGLLADYAPPAVIAAPDPARAPCTLSSRQEAGAGSTRTSKRP